MLTRRRIITSYSYYTTGPPVPAGAGGGLQACVVYEYRPEKFLVKRTGDDGIEPRDWHISCTLRRHGGTMRLQKLSVTLGILFLTAAVARADKVTFDYDHSI